MRRSTRSGREYGPGASLLPSEEERSDSNGSHAENGRRKTGGGTDVSKMPATVRVASPSPKQRPLLRGWIHVASVLQSIFLAYRLVLCAPTIGSAYAAICSCFCCGVGFAVSAYYHVVTHSPEWRAYVRKFDHACIFLTISGTYSAFIYRAYECTDKQWILGLLAAEVLLGVFGMATCIGGLVPSLTKLQRSLMYIAVSLLPCLFGGVSFGWHVYRWVAMGGVFYILGGLGYAVHRPNPIPGVFAYHECFHLAGSIANVLMMKGLEQAFLKC